MLVIYYILIDVIDISYMLLLYKDKSIDYIL